MSRFIDRILLGRIIPPRWLQPHLDARATAELAAECKGVLRTSHAIVCDRVTEYLYAGTDQENWTHATDFPRWLPPFTEFWMETVRPSGIISREHGRQSSGNLPPAWGHYFRARRGDVALSEVRREIQDPEKRAAGLRRLRYQLDAGWARYGSSITRKRSTYGPDFYQYLDPEEAHLVADMGVLGKLTAGQDDAVFPPDTAASGWVVSALTFFDGDPEIGRGVSVGPLATWQFILDSEGYVQGSPRFGLPAAMVPHSVNPGEWSELATFIYPALLALTLLTAGGLKLTPSARIRPGRRPYQIVVGDVAKAHAKEREERG